MATTNLGLGDHWDQFVTKQVASGRYDTANEVIREALRALEAREAKLATLIAHLEAGDAMDIDGFDSDLSIEQLIEELDAELDSSTPDKVRH